MMTANGFSSKWGQRVVVLSLLLLFFTIPHTLEDFATGEPAKAGIPAPLLSLVVSTIFFLQALGLYWLGQGRRRELSIHQHRQPTGRARRAPAQALHGRLPHARFRVPTVCRAREM